MERLHADGVEEVAAQLLPLLRKKDMTLSRRRDVVMILSSLCYKALLNYECPVILAETLKICPSHLSRTVELPSLNTDERINVVGETLDKEDMSTLEEGQWLNDKVVNAFLALLKVEKNRGDTHVIVLPSYVAVLWQAGNYDSWLFLKISFCMFSCILLPICDNGHWILMVVSPSERIVRVYDSLHGDHQKYFSHWLFYNFETKHCKTVGPSCVSEEKLENWQFVRGCSSKQEDGNNCGTFVLMNAEAIIKNIPTLVMRQAHCETYRKYVTKRLLMEGKRRNEETCDFVDSCSGPHKKWIQCDCCGKWLHMKCAQVKKVDPSYMCVLLCLIQVIQIETIKLPNCMTVNRNLLDTFLN
ncbi:sentrin-specific protease 1-like [Mercenaria mercenaria]|uniref:sentrin-specific protease 1-like n=1 Tax=Mercenaria mercenaria TaxID=6596 RepID=UPI001E1D48EE|nr:sentrin-specific protease 1-like [Mercenaria mercenaria]